MTDARLKGTRRRCVITGAASGIGAALAELFVKRGYEVIGIDRDPVRADALHKNLGDNFRFVRADLAVQGELERLANELSGKSINVFIHSAGINAVGAFETSDIGLQRTVLDVNLRAPLQLSRMLLAQGTLARGSTVVFISSLSHFVSYPGAAVYAASKDGLTAYARSLGVALKPEGIQVLTVFPGPTRTPHAAQHSPDNSREGARMPPEVLAERLERALNRKRYRLVPGLANKLFALVGTYLPTVTERIMLRTLFAKLESRDP